MRMPERVAAVLLAATLSISLSVSAFAQKGKRGVTGPVPAAVLSRLNLNADQQAKIKAASDAYAAEQQKAKALATPQEKKQALRAARQSYQAALKGALTPEQNTQLTAILEEAKQYRGMGPLGMQLAGLNLSADQKTKILAISAKYAPEIQKLNQSRKGATDRKAIQGQVRELSAKLLSEVKTVLTPEQQQQLGTVRRGKKNKA